MKNRPILFLIAFATLVGITAAYLSGCAVQGGGATNAEASALLDKVFGSKLQVLDNDAATYVNAAASCNAQGQGNAQAAKNYNAAQVICMNPSSLITEVNSTPAGAFVTAQVATLATQLLTAKCTVDGFGPSLPATITQVFCPANPTPSAAPSPA